MPKQPQNDKKDILNADTYRELNSIITSVIETVKTNKYGKISIITLNEYFDLYKRYCYYLSKGVSKMQAYENVSEEKFKSAEVVRRAVSKVDNLICEPLEKIKDALSDTEQTNLSMNRLHYYWEVFNKFRFWYEVYGLNKMDAYRETASNLNISPKYVRQIVKAINDTISKL